MPSVIQDWVADLPLRQQGTMILALRGPDGIRKESPAKAVIRSLRGCVMVTGRTGVALRLGEQFQDDRFMRMDLIVDNQAWAETCDAFYGSIDEYNLHFFQHLLHAAAVLGFNHPVPAVAANWLDFYHRGVHKLHMKPETRDEFVHRLRNGKRDLEDAA